MLKIAQYIWLLISYILTSSQQICMYLGLLNVQSTQLRPRCESFSSSIVCHTLKLFLTINGVKWGFRFVFAGFGKRRSISVHQLLVDFLKVEIGDLLAPPSLTWRASLSDIWASGKRVILAYNDATTVAANGDILWSAVSQKWGDVQTLEDLHSYLEGLYLKWVEMINMKQTTADCRFYQWCFISWWDLIIINFSKQFSKYRKVNQALSWSYLNLSSLLS